ncbi:dihydrofolate reductase [Candidatus Kuenenbacteria bacterium CG_4_9_14_3_um_filter_39_14]|uniref:Dihydrofolate reductase n=7 Tax=Candidatus Kueneniibacteriota TaxID=1752740 RepID=A0A2M7ILE3_9BACT|nr:dihydrofolate reductase [Candidatus Kuenenbacteria bacterium]OIP56336.1 MAG: hypothetical protein AUK13_01255 [Candidatus Kuenenbacteria bacterium CG2_30_39_24]PIP28880.1 MAG: dihydrofolate reductase [Candidatus Kuenenbacteria bacterium CG23_combo_of_CG06-09_8_20_14_all_39_39]PIP75588.1 MAG: dihydrofolate reductase [Candidatus Kuenenbacteria bacterium CG22_combo_CG10-13_8_21_14_all_39_9]PIR80774.1 MAG: dihydrofolate reductase [Candidatus Kuenenbacteria bacterium CG10_big_fil_rev_8_21_14_0_10
MKKILMMAITVDGKIAKDTDQPATWTSQADKKMFIAETKRVGVIVMGKTTYDTIGKPLPGRLNIVMDFDVSQYENIPGTLEYTNKKPEEIIAELESRGFKEMIVGGGSTINGLFLSQGLIDEIWLTIEPKIFGEGLSLFKGADVDLALELIEIKQLDNNIIHLRYKIKK